MCNAFESTIISPNIVNKGHPIYDLILHVNNLILVVSNRNLPHPTSLMYTTYDLN